MKKGSRSASSSKDESAKKWEQRDFLSAPHITRSKRKAKKAASPSRPATVGKMRGKLPRLVVAK